MSKVAAAANCCANDVDNEAVDRTNSANDWDDRRDHRHEAIHEFPIREHRDKLGLSFRPSNDNSDLHRNRRRLDVANSNDDVGVRMTSLDRRVERNRLGVDTEKEWKLD